MKVAFDAMIGKFDSAKHAELFMAFREDMMRVPLLESKEAYEKSWKSYIDLLNVQINTEHKKVSADTV